jgi:beta-galactosidase GanA
MKLRDHPLVRQHLIPQWPPVWVSLNNEDERISGSDEGMLTEVRESISRSDGIVLIMHHNNNRYGSILLFSHLGFCGQIFELLKDCVGLSIQQVGDIDLRYTL